MGVGEHVLVTARYRTLRNLNLFWTKFFAQIIHNEYIVLFLRVRHFHTSEKLKKMLKCIVVDLLDLFLERY